ncbi:putative virus X resistance protein-like, coiled-coil [Helianthus debilis subsp. tardiflorus]
MAETLANELLKVLVKKMTDEAFKRIARAQGIHNELKELKKTLSRIQDLLQDASQKEVTHKSVKEWLNALQHLAYDIDDVLDDVATEAMRRELTLQQEPAASTSKLFTYCSLFPKDYLFDKEELVLLWMAEGFLSPSNATKSPERLGHDYFEILLSRSFFQHAPNDESLFIMHDLMNDLAMLVAFIQKAPLFPALQKHKRDKEFVWLKNLRVCR